MRRILSRAAATVALTFALAAPGAAYAQDAATAEYLFNQGLAAMKKAESSGRPEDYKAACDAFKGSDQADESIGAKMNIGVCSEKLGNLATAWAAYKEAANLSKKKDDPRMQTALAEASRIEPKLHLIVINVKPPKPEGLAVTRDGVSVPSVALEAGSPVDPGEHTIEVTAKGKKPWTQKVTTPATPGKTAIEVPALEDAPKEAGGGTTQPGGPDYQPPVVASSGGGGQRTIGLVVGGVGIVALLVGGGFQLFALSEADKRDGFRQDAKQPGLTPAQRAELDRVARDRDDAAKTNQTIAIIAGASGIVAVGVGAVLFFTASKGSSTGKPKVLPVAGPGYAGLGLGGSF